MRSRRRLLGRAGQLAEDADDVATALERHGADVDVDPLPARVEENGLGVGHLDGTQNLLREELTGATSLLARNDRRVVPPANIAEQTQRRRVDPANDS